MKYYNTTNGIRAIDNGQEFLVEADWVEMTLAEVQSATNPVLTRAQIKERIDSAAGIARQSFVSVGQHVDSEYQRALDVAQAWKAGGYIPAEVPAAVSAWASAKDWTDQQACDDIIATAAAWFGVLDAIRGVRLAGKAAVDAAVDGSDFEAVAAPYIAQLEAIRPA